MAKAKHTDETPKTGYAVNEEEAAFLKRIAVADAKSQTDMEGGEVFDFPVGEKVIGEFIKYEIIESKKGEKTKEFKLIHLKTAEGKSRFWSFGLLDHHMKKWNAAPGDIIVVMKKDKNDEGFWGGEFLHEKAEPNG